MTSAHRYPPPAPNSQNDFRLPSLKDLNFYRPSGAQPTLPPSQQQELGSIQPEQTPHPARHPGAWSRSAYQPAQLATPTSHQQYTPAGHEVSPKLEYTPKHENISYAHPGVPLSVQTNSVTSSTSIVSPRNEDASHAPNQPKRQRTAPAASRDTRSSHPSVYPHPQYPSYPQGSQPQSASQYPSVAGLPPPPSHTPHPPPSSHEQAHHHPHPVSVTAHPGYAYPAYVHPRQTLLHPPSSSQVSQHHSNSYPPSAPPPQPPAHAPQPQGPWAQSHAQQPPAQFQQQPPTPTQHPQHNPHPAHAPSHHHHHQPQAPMPASSNQPVPAHHHHQQQPPPPPPPPSAAAAPPNPSPSQQIPSVQYHPHQQQYQNQYPHPSQQQQQQQQAPPSFVRPTAINPSSLENRPTYPVAEAPRVSSVPNDAMSEITDHCNILYSFANQYVTLQQSNPHAQPPPGELEEMSQRALKVVRLLNDFRRICIPESTQLQTSPTGSALASNSASMQTESPGPGESSRPPKRPWEDQEDDVPVVDAVVFQDQFPANPSPDPKTQSTAEQDMELIRTKRATSTAIANGSSGQPKSKYRKRSMGQRASPPGKCHSCNIRETPEWRRGPDGARTLCNACGLHYAKLMRKQNKTAGNGDAPPIDLETLRASTRAADIAEKGRNSSSKQAESSSSSSKANNKNQQHLSDTSAEVSTSGTATPAPPSQTHQGSFQLVNMMAPPQDHHPTQNHVHGPPPIPSSNSSSLPTPMQVDSRPTSQPQVQTLHAPPPPSNAPSHHSHPHPQHPQHHPPWPTTAATTGAAAAASGVVSASPTTSVRGGGSAGGSSFGNPPSQSPVDFVRRQYSMPNRPGNQQHQSSSR